MLNACSSELSVSLQCPQPMVLARRARSSSKTPLHPTQYLLYQMQNASSLCKYSLNMGNIIVEVLLRCEARNMRIQQWHHSDQCRHPLALLRNLRNINKPDTIKRGNIVENTRENVTLEGTTFFFPPVHAAPQYRRDAYVKWRRTQRNVLYGDQQYRNKCLTVKCSLSTCSAW